jgi:transposase
VINVSTLSKLRRLVLRQDVSVREASRRLGISRNTATKWLKDGQMAEPRYPQRVSGPSVLDPYKEQLCCRRPKTDPPQATVPTEN